MTLTRDSVLTLDELASANLSRGHRGCELHETNRIQRNSAGNGEVAVRGVSKTGVIVTPCANTSISFEIA